MFSLTSALVFASIFTASLATSPAQLVAELRDAPSAAARVGLLTDDKQFVFDFFNSPNKTVGAGGEIVLASSATFPAVVGNGAAMAIGILEPCGMNTPHTHPRATEIQFNVNGTLQTGMITENGARFVMTELKPGQMTIFPQGSIHFQFNDGCHPALFVSGFNSEDPGALQVAQRFLGLPPDIVAATLGDIGVEDVAGVNAIVPDNAALGTDACLKRCGIKRTTQGTKQAQPRVSGNAFPSGITTAKWTTATGH